MKETNSYSQKLKQFVLLFFPIFETHKSYFAMSFFDTTISVHASPIDLACVAIGTSIWLPVSNGLTG
ncbi:MATE family efflux transporter, partial [Bacillus sp. 'calajunan']